jgi:hypothetical protein
MRIKMKKIPVLLLLWLLAITFSPSFLHAEESGESGGEILKWDVDVGTVQVPQNLDAAEELREAGIYKFPAGTGAYFGSISVLEPWDYFDLYLEYPEGAWRPAFPFYFGASPVLNSSFTVECTTSVFDNSGHLVVRRYDVKEPPKDIFGGTAWYVGGNIGRVWDDWMAEPSEIERGYIPAEGVGIRYFLSMVHLGGVIGGENMKLLLKQVNAKEVSIQRTHRDERYAVYYIPPTAEEWEYWIGDLYVWINTKNLGIERHQVDLLYGREFCQYYNQLWNVQPDLTLFYLEWLPKRLLDILISEFNFEITNEEQIGPDEYLEENQWVKITGSGVSEYNPNEDEEAEENVEESGDEESEEEG